MENYKGYVLLLKSCASRIVDGGWKDAMKTHFEALMDGVIGENLDFDLCERRRIALKLLNEVCIKRDFSMFDDLKQALNTLGDSFCTSVQDFQGEWINELWINVSLTLDAIYRVLNNVPGRVKTCDLYPGCLIIDLIGVENDKDLYNVHADWDAFCIGLFSFANSKEDGYFCILELCSLAMRVFKLSIKYTKIETS